MTKPDPIQNWHFEVTGLPGQLQWLARRWEPSYERGPAGSGRWTAAYATEDVAYFDAEGFHVEDRSEYDGRSGFCVPLAVLDTLRALQAGEGAPTDAQRMGAIFARDWNRAR